MKKRFIIFIILLIFISISTYSENSTTRTRTFTGEAQINAGRFEDYFLRVITGESTIYAQPGETVNFKMYVRRGEDFVVLHNVQVIDDNDIFQLKIVPEVIKTISNVDMIMLDATLIIPNNIEYGKYPLKIKVKGDEFVEESYPLDTEIKIGKHSKIPDYLFILMTAIFIGIVIFRIKNIDKK